MFRNAMTTAKPRFHTEFRATQSLTTCCRQPGTVLRVQSWFVQLFPPWGFSIVRGLEKPVTENGKTSEIGSPPWPFTSTAWRRFLVHQWLCSERDRPPLVWRNQLCLQREPPWLSVHVAEEEAAGATPFLSDVVLAHALRVLSKCAIWRGRHVVRLFRIGC